MSKALERKKLIAGQRMQERKDAEMRRARSLDEFFADRSGFDGWPTMTGRMLVREFGV